MCKTKKEFELMDNHRDLFIDLIKYIRKKELTFYTRTSAISFWSWHILTFLAFITSVLSSVIAATTSEDEFQHSGRMLLVIIPAVGTVAAGTLHLFQFREKEILREEGRIEIESIIRVANLDFLNCESNQDFADAYLRTLEKIKNLDVAQHRRDTELRSEKTLRQSTPEFSPNVTAGTAS